MRRDCSLTSHDVDCADPLRRLLPALAILALISLGLAHATFGAFLSHTGAENVVGADDAYISFRYAQNIFDGLGAVYNAGERVEGYSNPLFVLLTVPGFWVVAPDAIYWWSVALNCVFMAAALLVLYGVTRKTAGHHAGAAAAFVFALNPVMWAWLGAGLETPMVLWLQLSIWAVTVSSPSGARDRRLSMLAVAAVVARPDGFIVPAAVAVHEYWRGHRSSAIQVAAAIVITTAVMTAWRLLYYGDALPNTYYAKVTGPIAWRVLSAAKQLLTVGGPSGLLVLIGVLGVLPFVSSASTLRDRVPLSTVIAAVLLSYWAYVGGDVFDERFLLVLFPLGTYEAFRLLALHAPAMRPAVAALALVVVQAGTLGHNDDRFSYAAARYDMWTTLGQRLREESPGAVLAIDGAGKVPYMSGLRTIDMLGLTNRTIARSAPKSGQVGHAKYCQDFVLAQQPDLIAAWVGSPQLDLLWGLTHDLYTAHGYTLKYLVNASRTPQFDREGRDANVIDVTDFPPSRLADLLADNYRYAVLARVR